MSTPNVAATVETSRWEAAMWITKLHGDHLSRSMVEEWRDWFHLSEENRAAWKLAKKVWAETAEVA